MVSQSMHSLSGAIHRRRAELGVSGRAHTPGSVQLAALVVVGRHFLVADGQRVQRAQQVLNDAVRVPPRVHPQAPPPLCHQALPPCRRRLLRLGTLWEHHACSEHAPLSPIAGLWLLISLQVVAMDMASCASARKHHQGLH